MKTGWHHANGPDQEVQPEQGSGDQFHIKPFQLGNIGQNVRFWLVCEYR